MKKSVLYIVPSRGRPDKISELIGSWVATRSVADLLVVVDDDDPTYEQYEQVDDNVSMLDWVLFQYGTRKRLGPTLNEHALVQAENYDYIGFMGDDHRPRTPVWDGLMARELRRMGGRGIVYPNDLYQGKNLPTSVLMSASIITDIGFMCPPGVIHMYLDNFWRDLGEAANCLRYMDHVGVEHMHPSAGKAPMDPQYEEVNADKQFKSDGKAYEAFRTNGGFQNAVDAVMGLEKG